MKYIGGRVRLVAAYAEREADVAEIFRNEVVKSLCFFQIGVQALGQFLRFGANFGRGFATIFLEFGVPAANLFPAFESRQLNVGLVVIGTAFLFLLVLLFLFGLGVVVAFEMRSGPVVDASSVLFGDLGFHAELAFQL